MEFTQVAMLTTHEIIWVVYSHPTITRLVILYDLQASQYLAYIKAEKYSVLARNNLELLKSQELFRTKHIRTKIR